MQVLDGKFIFFSLATLIAYINASHAQLTANEGDRVYLPCLNLPDERVFYWSIGSITYPIEDLPHYVRAVPDGLIIYYAATDLSGDVSCYTYEADKSGVRKVSSLSFLVSPGIFLNDDTGAETEEEMPSQDRDLRTELSLRVTLANSIFIPCRPQHGFEHDIITNWEINGVLYPVLDLPANHIASPYGIYLYDFSSASSFRCYITLQGSNKIQLQYSVNVHLSKRNTTNNGMKLDTYSYKFVRPHQLKIISRKVSFNQTSFNVQYRIANETLAPICTSGVSTDLIISDHRNDTLLNDTSNLYKPEFTIPSTIFDDDKAYGRMNTTNSTTGDVCAKLDHPFRIDIDINDRRLDQCTPEFGSVCISLPEDLVGLEAIWPTTPQSDEDCVCGVFFTTSDSTMFKNCKCFKQNLTNYTVVLNETTRELCWKNLTRYSNDTKVLFARAILDTQYKTRYTSQATIVVEDKDPNKPTITEEEPGEVRIVSRSPDWSNVLNTGIQITDATGDSIKNGYVSSDNFTEDFGSFPQSCEPFIVTAVAFTQCSRSDESVYYAPGKNGNETRYCECLDAKVNLSKIRFTSDSNKISVDFDISCLNDTQYDLQKISNLHLKVHQEDCTKNCTTQDIEFTLQCNQSSMSVEVTGLTAETLYSLSIVWKLPKAKNVSTSCPLTSTHKVSTSMTLEKKIIIGCSIGGVLVVIIVIILLLLVARIAYSRTRARRCNVQRPRGEMGPPPPIRNQYTAINDD